MRLAILLFSLLTTTNWKIHASSLFNDFEDLDYSHNIFIPLNAYDNYELFMEFAKGSELGNLTVKRSQEPRKDLRWRLAIKLY